ncbi:MAG TPA: DUF3710 domain-containing protein [Candidatus Janibacter merdipullorum]|nr:DUF3710 domain-containing protein [Candidatus Janibacter merdipullorum]
MMFGRKKKDAARDAAKESEETVEEQPVVDGGDESAEEATPQGPLDRGQVTDLGNRIDLGSVHVMPGPGMELRLEVDSSSQEVSALQLADDDGAVQVQVFAAPRSSGIWDEIRGEIAEMIRGNGGTVEETTGTFGEELRTRLAQPGPQGRTVFAPALFAGVDGRRWFLRAVYSGAPAIDDEARARYDDCLRSIVVSRGDEPRAPREMLPLTMPEQQASSGPVELDEDGEPARDDLKPFERGPEITEVR